MRRGIGTCDILTLAGARCVRVGCLKAGGSWALRFPPPQKIKLTAVVKGACWLAVDGEGAPLRLETGDVFVVGNGCDVHRTANGKNGP